MIINNILIPYEKLTTVSIDDTIAKTLELIDSKTLLSLPVVDGGQFIGIISKRYILEEFFNENEDKTIFLKRPVSEFMKTKIASVSPNDLIEEALNLLCENNVQFIPVINEKNEFVGIVSHKAAFKAFRNALGIGHTRLVITTYDLKGRLAKLAELIAKENGNIISIVQLNPEVMGLKELIIRVEIANVPRLVKTLNKNGFTVRQVNE